MNKTIGLATMEKFDNRKINSVGSSRIRMRWLLPYWQEAEEYGIGKKYDVMIFQKVYWGNMMKAFEGIKILDLCDPDWLENKPVFEFVDYVDAVTTSTEALANYVRKIRPNKLVKCIPDRIYIPEAVPVKQDHAESLLKVVWFGYSHNAHYLSYTYDELIKRNIELVVISDDDVSLPMMYRGKLNITNIVYKYDSINKDIIKYDAVLMPDADKDERAKYKSNNKTLQAWSLGMPVIKIQDDIDRLLSKEARIKEGAKNRQEVIDKWDVKFSVDEYRALIEEIRNLKK
jgi:hypothetical protein